MRLRNIPGAKEKIANNEFVIHQPEEKRGNWGRVFNNDHPIEIEIGMGKGKFIQTLALQNPNKNYIGIEKYESVLIRALEKRTETELDNLYYICMDAKKIDEVFASNEVDNIYLNFSDPWPKDRHSKRRLTAIPFFERYNHILKQDGRVVFKTDNKDLFDFSLVEVVKAGWVIDSYTYDLHNSEHKKDNVMTEYEERFSAEGVKINQLIAKR